MKPNLLNFDGRICLVTGAAGGGIGTTVTRMLAEAGATVLAVSRSDANLDKNIKPLVAQGLTILPVKADVSNDDGIAAVMAAVRGTRGTLHGLVNVAGGAAPATWIGARCSIKTSRPCSS
jgi:NAD(P)-dependent dehydrogenase (short-subunit alcohol dehydrogenase family)